MNADNRRLSPVQHRLIGRPAQVAAVLRAAQARGHLIGMSQPVPVSGHRVAVTVTILQPPDATIRRHARLIRWRMVWRVAKPALITLAVVAVLFGLGWLGWVIYQWVSAHWVPLVVFAVLGLFAYGTATAANENRAGDGR